MTVFQRPIISTCLGVVVAIAIAPDTVWAQSTSSQMMAECRNRAHEVLRTRLPNIETKYEGQRTDGTHAVNGTTSIQGNRKTFQCSFNRRGNRIVKFIVNQGRAGAARPPRRERLSADSFRKADAIRACELNVHHSYHFPMNDMRETRVARQGAGGFEVEGQIRQPGRDKTFRCIIIHREVVSVKIGRADSVGETIGKGIAGALLVGVANALQKKLGSKHQNPHPAYTQGNPFLDKAFLQRSCKHEIMRNLKMGHGSPRNLRFTNFQMSGRVAAGDGIVRWSGRQRNRVHFTCTFDRRGRVHDGHYSYY